MRIVRPRRLWRSRPEKVEEDVIRERERGSKDEERGWGPQTNCSEHVSAKIISKDFQMKMRRILQG